MIIKKTILHMRDYDISVLKSFESEITYIERFGVPNEVRQIPDGGSGRLDPREIPYAENFKSSGNALPDYRAVRRSPDYISHAVNDGDISINTVEIPTEKRAVRTLIYTPKNAPLSGRAGFIYLHGGSFFAGSPSKCEKACMLLAEKACCSVFSVDYSLAPERPYPDGYDDCRNVFEYIYENAALFGVNREKLCIGGDSAGGLFAAAVGLSDIKRRIKLSVYFYPCVTFEHTNLPFEWNIADYDMCDEQRGLIEPKLCLGRADGKGNDKLMLMIKQLYLQHDEDLTLPSISPIHGDFTGFNRTLIFTAEFDGLRYHGEYLAGLLKKSGVSVRVVRYRGVFHAFMEKIGYLPQPEDAVSIIAGEMKSIFTK